MAPTTYQLGQDVRLPAVFRVVLGCRKVEIELDSLVTGVARSGAHSHLLNHIEQFRKRAWKVSFKHIYRKTNSIADGLAKMALNDLAGGGTFHSPPLHLWSLLQQEHSILQAPILVASVAGAS
ncbi:hypothetical protein V6N11_021189 [Hibiscus sabdariffa]|uniref:Uncharacterized protein n=2 Tax=Hibiscus sabdariffa TaxID=183260 RepID=A0ABR2NLR8_9ROSI